MPAYDALYCFPEDWDNPTGTCGTARVQAADPEHAVQQVSDTYHRCTVLALDLVLPAGATAEQDEMLQWLHSNGYDCELLPCGAVQALDPVLVTGGGLPQRTEYRPVKLRTRRDVARFLESRD
jgi:hypothetical protein